MYLISLNRPFYFILSPTFFVPFDFSARDGMTRGDRVLPAVC